MLALDHRPLPNSVPAAVRAQTAVAAAMRAGPGMAAVESLLALEESGLGTFDDFVAERYITEHFGSTAFQEYLSKIPNAAELVPVIDQGGWKCSPLSTGLALGSDVLGGGERFLYARHLRLISEKIIAAVRGTGKRRIAVAMPYRHGKSALSCIATPVWFLANWPHLQVGLVAHSDSLSTKFSRLVRNAIHSNAARLGFGLAADSQSVHEFHTTCGGGLWQGSNRIGHTGERLQSARGG